MHTRIVRHADDHSCIHACIRTGKQWVSRNIQSHMLHSAKTALSCQRCAKRNFHSHLFIRSPFTINLIILGCFLCHFRTRRSRITGYHTASRLVQPPCQGLITQHQLFHNDILSLSLVFIFCETFLLLSSTLLSSHIRILLILTVPVSGR